MSPAAGKMRLNTRSAGICSTKRRRPVSVSRLTRMLVPKPKNAFQSPGTHSFTLFVLDMTVLLNKETSSNWSLRRAPRKRRLRLCALAPHCAQGSQNSHRIRHPAEDTALSRDHPQADFMEQGEIGSTAIGRDNAAIAAIVGFAHRGMYTHFRGHAADDERLDAAVMQDCMQI